MASLPDAGSTSPSPVPTAPRPPTPPRESCREPAAAAPRSAAAAAAAAASARPDPTDSRLSPLQTPPTANTPTSGAFDSSTKTRRKRVEWSAHTEYKEYPDLRRLDRLAKSSPLSALSPRPIKGILKPSQSNVLVPSSMGSTSDGSTAQLNIIDMLESTIKQLAGSDRQSKIDAYMMLSRALKASNNLPDRVALQAQMSLFMQFIRRDVIFKNPNGSLDPSLTNHALTLLATFLYFPAIASTLTNEFGTWTLDYATCAFEDASTPKDILRHLMQIVASQSFSSKVMTSARVGRLIQALHQIENHATGKSIVMSRIRIYRRLVKQSKNIMAHHLDWIEDVFVDMLSGSPEIRTQAIYLATEAGFALRSDSHVSRKINDIFQTVNEDTLYIDFFIKRMNEMLGQKQLSASVPQIWAAVILFLPYPLDRWRHYSPWLKVIQSAFNTDDGSTKEEANNAWNRHIYLALRDSGKMSSKALATLCLPLLTQIRKKANPKTMQAASRLRTTVIGSICTAFYYLLAPGSDLHSNDFVWDIAIQPFTAELVSLDSKPDIPPGCLMQAASLLLGLLDVTTPRAWQEDRIQRLPPVAPIELPSLDAKWIRRNCDKVMQVVSPIIEDRFFDLADKETVVSRLWQALVGSVAAASARDIKVSEETVKFFACTMSLLSKIWSAARVDDHGTLNAAFLPSVEAFIRVLVKALGLLPFTEKRLSLSAAHTFWPLPTPQTPDRTSSSNTVDRPILHHLFLILSSGPPRASDDSALTDFFVSAIDPFLHGKTLAARKELVSELLGLLPDDRPCLSGPWVLAASQCHHLIESYQDGAVPTSSNSGKILGPSYRDVVSLLERGLTRHPNIPVDAWFSLFDRLSEHVADKFGEAGRCIIIIEPFAKILLDLFDKQTEKMSWTGLLITRALFEIAKFPRDRASLEIARHRLWGTPMNTARGSIFDPFEYLYRLGNHVLEVFYKQFRLYDPMQDVAPIVENVKDFIVRCFPLSRARTLSRLQSGLSYWIRDSKGLLGDSSLSSRVSTAWHDLSSELAGRRPLDRAEFDSVESVLSAALQSKNMAIVKRAAETWSLLVQDQRALECSDGLRSLASTASSRLEATNLSQPSTAGFGAQAQQLHRPPSGASLVLLSSASSSQRLQTPPSPSASDSANGPKRPKRKRRPEATPDGSHSAKSAKKTAASRAHHEQLQSEVATPSPSPARAGDKAQRPTEQRQRGAADKRREKSAPPSQPIDSPSVPSTESLRQASVSDVRGGLGAPHQLVAPEKVTSVTSRPRSRAQSLQNEDLDVATSPLKPRAFPLLPEIQSRSKEKAGLNAGEWRLSSPMGTPSTGHQRGVNDKVKSPHVPPPTAPVTGTGGRAKKADRSQPPPAAAAQAAQTAVPLPPIAGSISRDGRPDIEMADADSDAPLGQVQKARPRSSKGNPQTPRKHHTGILPIGADSPRSVDEEFVDAEDSFEGGPAALPDAASESTSSSFSLSELDDSSVMKLIVELQSNGSTHDGLTGGVNITNQGGRGLNPSSADVDMQEEDEGLPLPPQLQKYNNNSERSPSPSLPPLISEPTETASSKTRPGQKRKRTGPARHSNQGKKRRADMEEIPETPGMVLAKPAQAGPSPERNLRRSSRRPAPPTVSKVQTRGSARRRSPVQAEEGEDDATNAVVEEASARARAAAAGKQTVGEGQQEKQQQEKQQQDDPADTDDEVLSQLMSESIASSHDMTHIEQELLTAGEGRRPHHPNQQIHHPKEVAATARPAAGATTDDGDAEPGRAATATVEKRMEKGMDVDDGAGTRHAGGEAEAQFQALLRGLQSGLAELRTATLSRDEFNRMEDVLMEMKRALFAAEERGRGRR